MWIMLLLVCQSSNLWWVILKIDVYYTPFYREYHLAHKHVSLSSENTINTQKSLLAYKEIASLQGRLKETNSLHVAVQYLMRNFNLFQLRLQLGIPSKAHYNNSWHALYTSSKGKMDE